MYYARYCKLDASGHYVACLNVCCKFNKLCILVGAPLIIIQCEPIIKTRVLVRLPVSTVLFACLQYLYVCQCLRYCLRVYSTCTFASVYGIVCVFTVLVHLRPTGIAVIPFAHSIALHMYPHTL